MQDILKFFFRQYVLFLVIVATFFSISALAQTPPLTPQDLKELLPGVDPSKIDKSTLDNYFKDNNQKVGSDRSKAKAPSTLNGDIKGLKKDSTQIDEEKNTDNRFSETYGANVFKNAATYNVGELSTPPLDYPLGVGDHIVVALWGGGEYQEDYVVARDGAIFPTSLGKITVQGLSFEVARSLIYARFKSVVPASTNIQITLGQPRSINVNVGGEVENPGPMTVSAFSNAYNVIGLAGGITEYGNLREIQVKRNGKVIETIDVYKYLASGEMGNKIYLQNNDFIFVNNEVSKVLATGQFKRPMYYQLKNGEGIKALIKYSGGFTSDALTSGVKVIRTTDENQVIHDVNTTSIVKLNTPDFVLLDGDIIKADLVKVGLTNKVELKGPVKYPGIYEFRTNDRLFDVINRAGGITPNTYLAKAYIFRGAGDSANLKASKFDINLNDFQQNSLNSPFNIALLPNDVIQLFANAEFGEQQFVDVFGEVRKEGKVKKYGGMTLQDVLYLSGGLKPSAEFGRLDISSIVDVDSAKQGLKPTQNIVTSYSINSNLELDSVAAKVVLKPYDQIFVRKNPTFSLQQNVQLQGLLKYPGWYPRLNKVERLSSFINRAGGILGNANIGGAILFRRKTDLFREKIIAAQKLDSLGRPIKDSMVINLEEPVSIDLYKALKYSNSKYDIVMQENDVLYVPETNPFITVQGRVQSPLKIAFDKEHTSLLYYIDKAGGFGVRPWRKRIYVKYANGRSKRTTNFLGFHFYPKLEEGATIMVPERLESKEFSNILIQATTTAIPLLITYLIFKLK